MNIYDIDSIKKGADGNYDLTQLTFNNRFDVTLYQYEVQRGEEMRIDLVSESIYGSNKYIDIILHINNIDNPLNIKEGAILRYPSSTDIELYRTAEEKSKDIKSKLANINKSSRKDSNREKYIKQGYSLPPTVLATPIDPVRIDGNNIVIGGSNF